MSSSVNTHRVFNIRANYSKQSEVQTPWVTLSIEDIDGREIMEVTLFTAVHHGDKWDRRPRSDFDYAKAIADAINAIPERIKGGHFWPAHPERAIDEVEA